MKSSLRDDAVTLLDECKALLEEAKIKTSLGKSVLGTLVQVFTEHERILVVPLIESPDQVEWARSEVREQIRLLKAHQAIVLTDFTAKMIPDERLVQGIGALGANEDETIAIILPFEKDPDDGFIFGPPIVPPNGKSFADAWFKGVKWARP
jgi:hypothetical protein